MSEKLFNNMQHTFKGAESRYAKGKGRRTDPLRERQRCVASVCMTEELFAQTGMRGTVSKITGLSEYMLNEGCDLRTLNETAAPRASLTRQANKKRFDSGGCGKWIWQYFHDNYSLVELDKARGQSCKAGDRSRTEGSEIPPHRYPIYSKEAPLTDITSIPTDRTSVYEHFFRIFPSDFLVIDWK